VIVIELGIVEIEVEHFVGYGFTIVEIDAV
jgi:hypothetical protein